MEFLLLLLHSFLLTIFDRKIEFPLLCYRKTEIGE
jgi:hypothetical protein